MFVELWFDVWCGSAVNAELLVVCACLYALSSKCNVLQEDAGLFVVRPMEGRVGVAVASLFFHSAFQNETVAFRVVARKRDGVDHV